jgi:Xaa-Pro aminopeptidase
MYLTNFYSAFPFIPDLEGSWTGRSHSFVILPAIGDPVLIADMPCGVEVAMPKSQIVFSALMLEAVGETIRKLGFSKSRIGLVGSDVLAVSMYQKIQAAVPDASWRNADHVLADLRSVKSPAEIERLRAAAKIGSRTIEAMMQAADIGTTHGEIVAAGLEVLVPAGGILYNSFIASGQGGGHQKRVSAAFPTWSAKVPLERGDWLRLGISGVLGGYYFDVSRSRPIGRASNRQVDAFEAAISIVEEGISELRPGTSAGAVATAGLRKQQALGYQAGNTFDGLGHGIGLGWDSPWLVPQETMKLVPGMVLNFEKTLLSDGYCGDFEETVLLTESGVERLTDARVRFW